MQDLAGAERYFTQAQALAKDALPHDHPDWLTLHRIAMRLRYEQWRIADALQHGAQALQLAHRFYGRNSVFTSGVESDYANVLTLAGRPREAIAHFERARAIERALGAGRINLAQTDVNLGSVYESTGDYDRAIELLTAALTVLPEQDPAQIRWRISAYRDRGRSLGALGRFQQAQADLEHALQLVHRSAGETAQEYAGIQLDLARVLIRAHRPQQAEAALTSAAGILGQPGAASDPFPIILSRLKALLALEHDDAASATRHITEALDMAQEHPEMDALWLAQIKLTAAQIALRRGDQGGARRLVNAALPAMRQGLSDKSPELAEANQLADRLASP